MSDTGPSLPEWYEESAEMTPELWELIKQRMRHKTPPQVLVQFPYREDSWLARYLSMSEEEE